MSVVEFIAEVESDGKIEVPEEYRNKIDSKVRVILHSPKKTASCIEDLFADFDGEYEAIEIDWGKPMGKEIW